MISKEDLAKKLEEAGTLFVNAKTEHEKNDLREQAYWLTHAMESQAPGDTLERAFSLWRETNGKIGLKPFEEKTVPPAVPPPVETKPGSRPAQTLWGTLYREFASGAHMDDRHFAAIFNRLPPSPQTHFVDAAEDHIRARAEEEKKELDTVMPLVLRDEEQLLPLIEKAKDLGAAKGEIIKQNNQKIVEWLHYHQTEPRTEPVLEEVLYGPQAAAELSAEKPDEIHMIFTKAANNARLTEENIQTLTSWFPAYEHAIRERFSMDLGAYIRIRAVSVGALLDAVPADPKQLALVEQSAVRQTLLNVPEEEYKKRIRIAKLIRAYSFGKELRVISIRQFFRGLVEKI